VSEPPVSVLIADDHPLVLSGLRMLIESSGRFHVVAECLDGEAALTAIRQRQPRIALLDLNMPKRDGLNVLGEIARQGASTRIVLMAATISDRQICAAVEQGAYGIIPKESAPDMILDCLTEAAAGRRSLQNELVRRAQEREGCRRGLAEDIAAKLTRRERQVALLVAGGLSTKEMAHRLQLSVGTVKIYLHNLFQKTNVSRRADLVAVISSIRDRLEFG